MQQATSTLFSQIILKCYLSAQFDGIEILKESPGCMLPVRIPWCWIETFVVVCVCGCMLPVRIPWCWIERFVVVCVCGCMLPVRIPWRWIETFVVCVCVCSSSLGLEVSDDSDAEVRHLFSLCLWEWVCGFVGAPWLSCAIYSPQGPSLPSVKTPFEQFPLYLLKKKSSVQWLKKTKKKKKQSPCLS